MATYNKNEMLPQRKEALERWAQFVEDLLQENVIPLELRRCLYTQVLWKSDFYADAFYLQALTKNSQ